MAVRFASQQLAEIALRAVRVKAALHILNQAGELTASKPKHGAEAAHELETLERPKQEYEQACEAHLAQKATDEQVVDESHESCDTQAELNDGLHESTRFNTSTGFQSRGGDRLL